MSEATKCPKCGEEVRTGGMRDMVRSLKRQLVLALEREATEKARADKAEKRLRDNDDHLVQMSRSEWASITRRLNVIGCQADAEVKALREFADKAEAERDEARAELGMLKMGFEPAGSKNVVALKAEVKRIYRLLQESDGHKRLARFAKRADERQAALVEQNGALEKEVSDAWVKALRKP